MLVKKNAMLQDSQAVPHVAQCHPLRGAIRAALIGALLTVGSVQAATPLPGAATPGGVLPSLKQPETAAPPTNNVTYPIPPVVERPLAADEGPKVKVQAFILDGVVDHPKQGISKQAVQNLVDGLRAKRPDGFTIGQLQEVANEVTQYYRKAGFILAQAFVPVQDVKNGVVTLQLLEGKLGAIKTEGNKRYSNRVLARPYKPLLGQPVTKAGLESAVLNMTDYPGLNAFAVLRPGSKVGETDLLLKVQKEKPYDFSVGLDNHGTEYIGEYRLLLTGYVNNLSGNGDRLSANLLGSSKPQNTVYGDIGYEIPVISPDYKASFGVSHNEFNVGSTLASQGITGKSTIANMALKRNFVRSRELNTYLTLDFSSKSADLTTPGVKTAHDKLSVLSLEGSFNSIDQRFHGINAGLLRFSHGFNNLLGAMGGNDSNSTRAGGTPGNFACGDFSKFVAYYSRWQSLFKNQALLFRFSGQYSNDLLTSLEQYQMGGPDNVRAYPVSEFLRDKAMFTSLEYVVNAPGFANKPAFQNRTWGELLQFSVFVGSAKGWVNDPLPSDTTRDVRLSGAGVGAQFTLPGQMLARMSLAKPIGNGPDPSNGRNPQFFFDVRYDF